jgi:hypothetical protein
MTPSPRDIAIYVAFGAIYFAISALTLAVSTIRQQRVAKASPFTT